MTGRDRKSLIVVAILVALAGFWLLLIQPKRSEASKLSGQISSTQAQLNSVRGQITDGEQARSTYTSSYTSLAQLGEAVPADDNVASLIVQVQSAASAARVGFVGLTLNPSGGNPAPSGSAAATQSAAAALPPGAAVGPAGLAAEPFTFSFSGSFFHLADFFGRLQRFVQGANDQILVHGRLMALNAISLGAGPRGFPEISATVAATTFILPPGQGPQGGATPAGPPTAAPPAAAPVASSSSSPPVPTAAITGVSR